MITFDEATHTYRDEHGNLVPSVTQILKPLHDLSRIPQAVLDRKAALGTAVHKVCELHLRGELDEDSIHPEVAPYFVQFTRFLAQSGFVPIAQERRVFSRRYFYAGTLDLYGDLNERRVLIDIKTPLKVHPVFGPQTAAYAAALREQHPELHTDERFVLRLLPSKYQLHPLNDPADMNTFMSALTLHHWKTRHGEAA